MRQADLSWSWNNPTTNQRCSRCSMMYLSKRSSGNQWFLSIQHSHDTIKLCKLHTFFIIHRRQNSCHTFCGHCLPASGWSDHKQIMPSRHSNFRCPTDIFLTIQVCEIRDFFSCFSTVFYFISLFFTKISLFSTCSVSMFQITDTFPETSNCNDPDSFYKFCFLFIFSRNNTACDFSCFCL